MNEVAATAKGIVIEIDGAEYVPPSLEMTGAQLKQLGHVPPDYRLFEEAHAADKEIKDADSVHLHAHEKFYSLPLGTVGGPLDELLAQQIKDLQDEYPEASLHEEAGNRHVHIPGIQLPAGWNKERTDVLLVIPPQYPSIALPGFEADADLRRSNGAQPGGSGFQQFDGKQYMHFCWNPANLKGQWISLAQAARFAMSRFLENA
jgi:hypothetical protein